MKVFSKAKYFDWKAKCRDPSKPAFGWVDECDGKEIIDISVFVYGVFRVPTPAVIDNSGTKHYCLWLWCDSVQDETEDNE